MKLLTDLGIESEIVVVALCGVVLCLLIISIVLLCRFHNMNKKYKQFMTGASGKSLEEEILSRFEAQEKADKDIVQMKQQIKIINESLLDTYSKMAIVKYDAFKEMGGKLSFALALLDNKNNGFIINSMHSSREGCYTYVKEIIKGESFVLLAEEEKEALALAIEKNNYMK